MVLGSCVLLRRILQTEAIGNAGAAAEPEAPFDRYQDCVPNVGR
jgi:hypothetical protein